MAMVTPFITTADIRNIIPTNRHHIRFLTKEQK